MSGERHLIWLRNDLRLHDHPAFHAAADGEAALPVVILPERLFGVTSRGLRRTGVHRARFFLETIAALGEELDRLGVPLLVARGEPAAILPWLVRGHRVTDVWYQDEAGTEEKAEADGVAAALAAMSPAPTCHVHHSQTLLHPDDLPFELTAVPWVFTQFRRRVEDAWTVRPALPAPVALPAPPPAWPPSEPPARLEGVRLGLPDEEDLAGAAAPPPDPRAAIVWTGGERAARARVEHYLWSSDSLRRYKETRNGLLGADYSSKFSAWLANGSLSPRLVHDEVRRYEDERVRNRSTYWLIFELLWRDHFSLLARRVGPRLFRLSGPKNVRKTWRRDPETFDRWRTGATGQAFIDANMVELAATGFMSNRGRQVVASYFARDLGLDWRLGAEHFESLLLDYDPASNYGNWAYVAGVGTDPRADRRFDPERQAARHDPAGRYRRTWLADQPDGV